ncbi:MAG: hypothetical protein PHU21_09385, partial [Elusimicrobia bacterium]|nr:hypothetical protein [Elusimicrobiota bacterium]
MAFSETRGPGLYVMEDERGRRAYAVNLERGTRESDLAPAASAPWRGLSVESLRDEFWLKVRGREARGAVLAVAAACLVFEILLSLPRAFILV